MLLSKTICTICFKCGSHFLGDVKRAPKVTGNLYLEIILFINYAHSDTQQV